MLHIFFKNQKAFNLISGAESFTALTPGEICFNPDQVPEECGGLRGRKIGSEPKNRRNPDRRDER